MMTTLLATEMKRRTSRSSTPQKDSGVSMDNSQNSKHNSKQFDSFDGSAHSGKNGRERSRRARSVDSLNTIQENVKTCMNLVQMSNLSLAPSSGVLSLDGQTNNKRDNNGPATTRGRSQPNRTSSNRVKGDAEADNLTTKEGVLRAARDRVRQRKLSQSRRSRSAHPPALSAIHEYQQKLTDVQSWLDRNQGFLYQDFKEEFDKDFGYDKNNLAEKGDSEKENAAATPPKQDKMLAKATNKLVEHVRDVTSKTKSTCCIGKPLTTQPYPSKPMTQSQHHQAYQSPAQNNHHQQNQQNQLLNNHYLQPQQQNNYHYQHQQQQQPQHTNNKYNQQYQQHNYYASPAERKENMPNQLVSPPRPHQGYSHSPQPHLLTPQQHAPSPAQMMSPENPHYVVDIITGTTYLRGRMLGKGGFAKCYELTDLKSNKTYAGKIISKQKLTKPHQKEKILREIELHKCMKHKHVVSFHSYFEDDDNVYIILENCSRKSLVHILKNRKTLTEPEVRYYMRHLVDGCRYIHRNHIIHRDLKLGNMLLNESMQVKVADFGLASKVEFEGEKKMTVCGTPNYIAPEVLQKKGHSYEADIWALGCIMYAMLVGRPPFETATLKETYTRITSNRYTIPPHISNLAASLIQKLLHPDPAKRPSLDKILFEDFFTMGYLPKSLSNSCCDTAPKFPVSTQTQSGGRRPSSYAAPVTNNEAMHKISSSLAHSKGSRKSASQIITSNRKPVPEPYSPNAKQSTIKETVSTPVNMQRTTSAEIQALPIGSAICLYKMLTGCLEKIPGETHPNPISHSKPLWVTKWVDYSNKYGFGFQLSDKSVGILFNDTTRMLLATDGRTVLYNDLSNKVYSFTTETAPADYQKKVTLLLYFAQYMDEHLIHGGDMLHNRREAKIPKGVFMKKWFRTSRAIIMYLSNGTLQVNFFEDHTKVILSPAHEDYLLTYINSARQACSYNLKQFTQMGCSPDVQDRLRYSRRMLESIINIEGEAV